MTTIIGTNTSDALLGTFLADTISGHMGDDTIYGLASSDLIYGENNGTNLSGGGGSSASEFQINTATVGNQLGVRSTAIAGGGFLTTWISTAVGDNVNGQVRAQFYDASGNTVGTEFGIGTSAAQSNASFSTSYLYAGYGSIATNVTQLSDGTYIVLWNADYTHIVGQRLDASGNASGTEFAVNGYQNYDQAVSDVQALAGGGFAVVWQTAFQDGDGYGVAIRSFAADGTPTTGDIIVNTDYTTWDQGGPEITQLSDGRLLVTWESLNQGADAGPSALLPYSANIYGQIYNTNGTPAGSNFQLNTTIADLQIHPSVAALANGGFVTSWTTYGQDGDSLGIYMRVFDALANGGVEIQVNSTVTDKQYNSNLATLADGSYMVIWQSDLQDGAGTGIYARISTQTVRLSVASFW